MALVFFGSSEFSLYALQACLDSGQKIALVITTPPQKKGRGLNESPTPVQIFAETKGLSVAAPETLKNPDLLAQAQNLKPEYFVVSSYGKIIPKTWLSIPSRYALNVHPSLLPKYRGAAPVNWPILLGDTETGISIAEVTAELDAGDLFFQRTLPIPPNTDAGKMTEVLGKASADALRIVFQELAKGDLNRTPQNHELYNYARKLTKNDARLNWTRSAAALHNQVRGLAPWPGTFFSLNGESVQLLQTALLSASGTGSAGQILKIAKQNIELQTGQGILSLEKVKPAGRKEMSAADFARGKRLEPGVVLQSDSEAAELKISKSYK